MNFKFKFLAPNQSMVTALYLLGIVLAVIGTLIQQCWASDVYDSGSCIIIYASLSQIVLPSEI